MKWLRNAFAIESPRDSQADRTEQVVADRLCLEIVRRHLTVPALAFLEMSRPLNSLGAQLLYFLQPLLSLFADPDACRRFARFLERRDSIDYLCNRIELFEREASADSGPDSGSDAAESVHDECQDGSVTRPAAEDS